MIPVATITKKIFTCDVCGNAADVQTWAFGFDDKRYEIDLCPKDSNGLEKVVTGYASKARKVTGQRRRADRLPKAQGGPRSRTRTNAAAVAMSRLLRRRTVRSR